MRTRRCYCGTTYLAVARGHSEDTRTCSNCGRREVHIGTHERTRVLLMCAGVGSRWAREEPKQFVDIDGEPLIERTLRLLGGQPLVIVARHARFDAVATGKATVSTHHPASHETLLDSIYCTQLELGTATRTIVLLGDVLYTEACLELIFGLATDFAVVGDDMEIFGMTYTEVHHKALMALMEQLRKDAPIDGRPRTYYRGRIRQLYRLWNGIPENRHWWCGNYYHLEDGTQDFDTVEEYDAWLRRRSST